MAMLAVAVLRVGYTPPRYDGVRAEQRLSEIRSGKFLDAPVGKLMKPSSSRPRSTGTCPRWSLTKTLFGGNSVIVGWCVATLQNSCSQRQDISAHQIDPPKLKSTWQASKRAEMTCVRKTLKPTIQESADLAGNFHGDTRHAF